MKISNLIKQSIDIMAQHGDIFVDIEFNGNRKIATEVDLQLRKQGLKEWLLVIVGTSDDNFQPEITNK
jgi:hypothetical protein